MYYCKECDSLAENLKEKRIKGCYESDYGVGNLFPDHHHYDYTVEVCPNCGADKDSIEELTDEEYDDISENLSLKTTLNKLHKEGLLTEKLLKEEVKKYQTEKDEEGYFYISIDNYDTVLEVYDYKNEFRIFRIKKEELKK